MGQTDRQTDRQMSVPARATIAAFSLLRKLATDWTWEDLNGSELAIRELTHPATSTRESRATAERLRAKHALAARHLLRGEGAKRPPARRMPARPQAARRLLTRSLRGAC